MQVKQAAERDNCNMLWLTLFSNSVHTLLSDHSRSPTLDVFCQLKSEPTFLAFLGHSWSITAVTAVTANVGTVSPGRLVTLNRTSRENHRCQLCTLLSCHGSGKNSTEWDPLQVPYTKGIRDTELKLEVVGQSEPRKRNSDEFRTKLSNGCIMMISWCIYTIREGLPKTVRTSAASQGFFLPLRRAVGQECKPGDGRLPKQKHFPKHFPKHFGLVSKPLFPVEWASSKRNSGKIRKDKKGVFASQHTPHPPHQFNGCQGHKSCKPLATRRFCSWVLRAFSEDMRCTCTLVRHASLAWDSSSSTWELPLAGLD